MDVHSLGWRTDLALLRLGGSTVEHHDDHVVVRTAQNPTYRWGNFLLLRQAPTPAELARLDDRFADALPGSAHRAIGVDDPDGTVAQLSALGDAGYDVDAATVLTTTAIHPPPRPSTDVVLRALRSDEDWGQRVELDLATNAGSPARFAEYARRRSLAERGLVDAGHAAWFGAFEDGRLLASLGVVALDDGLVRYQEVQTHPDARRRGLAGTLVHAAGQHALSEMGGRTLVIVADPAEGAIRIYRSVGFADLEVQLRAEVPAP